MKANRAVNISELSEISTQLHDIAARLSGFAPVLKMIGEKADPETCDALAMVAGMSAHLNERISSVADRLS